MLTFGWSVERETEDLDTLVINDPIAALHIKHQKYSILQTSTVDTIQQLALLESPSSKQPLF